MKEKFVDGRRGRGMTPEKAAELWDYIEPFAGYGFNKSHSVAYAMLAYQTAYLKAHHPVAFMAAMLTSELASTDKIAKYIGECRDMGIALLPPDVNESSWYLHRGRRDNPLRPGRRQGVGEGAVESVLDGAPAGRPLPQPRPPRHRGRPAPGQPQGLRVPGQGRRLRQPGLHRTPLWHSLDGLLDYAQRRRRGAGGGAVEPLRLLRRRAVHRARRRTAVRPWPRAERLRYEKEALGLFLTGNPLSEHQAAAGAPVTHTTAALRGSVDARGHGHPGRHGRPASTGSRSRAAPTPAASWAASCWKIWRGACR